MAEDVSLLGAFSIRGRTAQSRVLFGPHVTNLGDERAFSARHRAYYERRAAGGAGVIVTETASIHGSDWPYERAPAADLAADGWAQIGAAAHRHGTLVLASLGHAGLQGSSAYSQQALWAPSPFADPDSRELPMELELDEIDELVVGFARAAGSAADAGLDGVEVDVGPRSLLRQFLSGLTNQRTDAYGCDKLLLTRRVLDAVRAQIGTDRILSLRLCCDELAPWGGITPEESLQNLTQLAGLLDMLVVVRGGPYSVAGYRPDAHTEPTFNLDLCRRVRSACPPSLLLVLQGSVVEVDDAERAVVEGTADLVEMTRAQIADAELVVKARAGRAVRPCLLCNQRCLVHDVGNPFVSCIVDPDSGYETEISGPVSADHRSHNAVAPKVLVVGGGPAGMEAARVLAEAGCRVRLVERDSCLGGALRRASVGSGRDRLKKYTEWLESELLQHGVVVDCEREIDPPELDDALLAGLEIILATGSRFGGPAGDRALDALDALDRGIEALPPGRVVVHDPIGGPIGVGVAEWAAAAGRSVALVTPDLIAGSRLGPSGDLVDAHVRLQRAGVTRELRAVVRAHDNGWIRLEDVWTGQTRDIVCDVLLDCGPRLPEDSLAGRHADLLTAGDCVAPRSVYEAVLDGRRAAVEVSQRLHRATSASGSAVPTSASGSAVPTSASGSAMPTASQ